MFTRHFAIAATLLLALGACDASDEPTEPGVVDDTPGPGLDETPTGTDEPSDDEPAPRLPVAEITIHIDALQPGEEREMCRNVKLGNTEPFLAHAFELDASVGLHHTNVMAIATPMPDGEAPCFGFPDDVMSQPQVTQPRTILGTSSQVNEQSFALPEGVALDIAVDQQLTFNWHFINFGLEPIQPSITVRFYAIEETELTSLASSYALFNTDIHIPPGEGASITTECEFPDTVEIASITPHMHGLGERFRVEYLGGDRDGEVLFETQYYDDPSVGVFDPPLRIPRGQGLRFQCDWGVNETEDPIGWGETTRDEMCIVFGHILGTESLLGGPFDELGGRCLVLIGNIEDFEDFSL